MDMLDDAATYMAKEWYSAGVMPGDTLMLHSNFSRSIRKLKKMGVSNPIEIILRSFLLALGDSGTLVVPLFNFDFTRGVLFDIRCTPSKMGVFTEYFRNQEGVIRTGHPVYSFATLGKNAKKFGEIVNFSAYGNDSPFAMLCDLGGKIGIVDLPDQDSMTFYHYVEEHLSVPYRYHKIFSGEYVDLLGASSHRDFGIFVRDLDRGVVTTVDKMGEILWAKGLYSGFRPSIGCGLRVIDAKKVFSEVSKIIKAGRAEGLLYEVHQF